MSVPQVNNECACINPECPAGHCTSYSQRTDEHVKKCGFCGCHHAVVCYVTPKLSSRRTSTLKVTDTTRVTFLCFTAAACAGTFPSRCTHSISEPPAASSSSAAAPVAPATQGDRDTSADEGKVKNCVGFINLDANYHMVS